MTNAEVPLIFFFWSYCYIIVMKVSFKDCKSEMEKILHAFHIKDLKLPNKIKVNMVGIGSGKIWPNETNKIQYE